MAARGVVLTEARGDAAGFDKRCATTSSAFGFKLGLETTVTEAAVSTFSLAEIADDEAAISCAGTAVAAGRIAAGRADVLAFA